MTNKTILRGDEGMWLPNALPIKRLKQLYGFEPTEDWAEHVQKASVRMNNGGSASFVSRNGLLATNHHVARGVVADLSSEKKDYIADGFCAESLEDEARAPQLEVNILWEIEDVTERIMSQVLPGMSTEESQKAKREEIIRVEKESFDATGMRSDVVTLYQGGRYHLYRYKKYTDVRLVFAPEQAIASFGGDFDNFEYPRYSLDVAFLRVYENGKPLETRYFFKWAEENSKEGDLVFVSGHPGSTDRLSTFARIKHLRDSGLPYQLGLIRRKEILLQQYSGRSAENARRASDELDSVQNTRKVFLGELAALQDPAFMAAVIERENILRDRISADPKLREANYLDAWALVEKAEAKLREIREELNLLEGGMAFSAAHFHFARKLLRLAEENKKPNHERFREYADASRDSLLHHLFSPAPIYSDLEECKLADSLALFAETMGFENGFVRQSLNGKSPKERARELISGSKLADADERKRVADGGEVAIMESLDPFILLARLVDARARELRKIFEAEVEEVRERAYAMIAGAQFLIYGEDVYPDATFTLRFAFGKILGYVDGGTSVPCQTTIGEAFSHSDGHNNEGPWKLPKSWEDRRKELSENGKALDFVSTNDIHGGNSGSPVIDKDLRIVGLVFDGNLQGFGNNFIYISLDDAAPRSVSVHAAGILEALKKVYGAERIVRELIS